MNARYLFRAKRIDNGELIEGFLIFEKDRAFIAHRVCEVMNSYSKAGEEYGFGNFIEVDPSTICQCTGLKDKNGDMVFENDMMSAHLDDYFPEDITYARVIWGDTGYCLREKDSIDIQPLEEIDMEYFTVCGNVFDNPELLEQEV